jgi:hypothetical protein
MKMNVMMRMNVRMSVALARITSGISNNSIQVNNTMNVAFILQPIQYTIHCDPIAHSFRLLLNFRLRQSPARL